MSKFAKVLLLANCAGICFLLFTRLEWLTRSNSTFLQIFGEIHTWRGIQNLFGMWQIGFFMCLIFGTPLLLIIEKFFRRFKTRYITGGFIAGWVAWLFTNGPLFEPNVWFVGYRWVLGGINYVGIYIWLGFCTGLLFTALLWAMNKLDGKKP
jgi:hypothetical protein